MNYKAIKKPEKRVSASYSSSLGIQLYGEDNLYLERMGDLIANSPTGGTCLERYISFLEGNGFNSEKLAFYVCNHHGDTMDEILHLIADDLGRSGGFALHIDYNLKGEVTELYHIPFRSCRLDEEDDAGYIPFISVHPDWEGNKTRRGRTIAVNKRNIRKFYPFNPKRDVVLAQMAADGGIDAYRGQVLWFSTAGRGAYPTTIYDKVATELSVDEGLSNVKYRNVRNNFLMAGMLIRKKGAQVVIDDDGNERLEETDDDEEFQNELMTFQGDTNACSLMDVTYQQEEDIPKFVGVEGVNFDKKFMTTESSTIERIYAAFGQEPWYCVRVGKVGFSGDILREAYEYYNSYVENTRRTIAAQVRRVFKYWFEEVVDDGDFSIQPLVYQYNYSNGSLDEQQSENGANGVNNDKQEEGV